MTLKKREKKMLIALAVVAVISAIILLRSGKEVDEPTVTSTGTTKKVETKKTSPSRRASSGGGRRSSGSSSKKTETSVSLSDFKKHGSVDNCWIMSEGYVYNVTEYIKSTNDLSISHFCGTLGFEAGYIKDKNKISSIVKQFKKIGKLS